VQAETPEEWFGPARVNSDYTGNRAKIRVALLFEIRSAGLIGRAVLTWSRYLGYWPTILLIRAKFRVPTIHSKLSHSPLLRMPTFVHSVMRQSGRGRKCRARRLASSAVVRPRWPRNQVTSRRASPVDGSF
jgi:hypothetical protein